LQGSDSDIDLGALARLSPAQPRRSWHAFQHVYLWFLYGLLLPAKHFVHDFRALATGRIAKHRFPRPRGRALAELIVGKLFFVGYAFVLPALVHPWWAVLLFYGLVSMVVGLILSVVFQLAHCVDEASFPEVPLESRRMPDAWSVHQVQTSVDFARRSRVLAWFLGGLNFQIEHHLFPKICHVHYPQIAPIVQDTCEELGIRYVAHDTLTSALASHLRWLRRLGRPVPVSGP
jgi:linoleoyl-CoA desaturase